MRAPTRHPRTSRWWAAARPNPTRPVRVAVWMVALEAVLLVGLGVSAIAPPHVPPGQPSGPAATIAVFEMTRAHGLLLIVTGLVALAALRHPAWRLGFAVVQTAGYLVITVLGLALPRTPWWQLNGADQLLHAALFLLGVTLLLLLRASAPASSRAEPSSGTPG